MHRIDGAGNVNGSFVAEDPGTSRPPTEITPEIMNAFQEEIVSCIEAAGLPLDKGDNAQLLAAILEHIDRAAIAVRMDTNGRGGGDDASTYAKKVGFTIFEVSNLGTWPEPYGLVVTNWASSQRSIQLFVGVSDRLRYRSTSPTTYPAWSEWAEMATMADFGPVAARREHPVSLPPSLMTEIGPKAFKQVDASTVNIVSSGADGRGFRLMQMRKGVTTTNNSAGGTADLWRVCKVFDLQEAYAVKKDGITFTGAGWADYTVSASTLGLIGSSASSAFVAMKRTTTSGDYAEIPVTVGPEGKTSLGFLLTAGSSTAIEIYVDNVLKETISNVYTSPRLYCHELRLAPGTHTLKVKQAAAGTGYLYFIGANFWPLDKAVIGAQYDTLFYYNSDRDYINNEGASDYALYDSDAKQYCGSYHGGETSLELKWLSDGKEFVPTVGAVVVARQFEVRQKTSIVGKLTSYTRQRFAGNGTHQFEASMVGNMNVTTVYSGMVTTNEAFSQVAYPRRVDMAPLADLSEVNLGRTPVVSQENPTTGQRLTSHLTLFPNDQTNQKNVFVRKAVGAYNKVYYGIAVSGSFALTELSWAQVRVFE